jgi:Protein of unknown function (DUF2887)
MIGISLQQRFRSFVLFCRILCDNLAVESIELLLCVGTQFFTRFFSLEQSRSEILSEMLDGRRIIRVYLDELGSIEELPASLSLMVLTTFEGEVAIDGARGLIDRAGLGIDGRAIIDLVTTIMVYKFNNLTRNEVDAMLGIELTETRVYQDAKAEGRVEGHEEGPIEEAKKLALKLLRRKYGSLGTGVIRSMICLLIDWNHCVKILWISSVYRI